MYYVLTDTDWDWTDEEDGIPVSMIVRSKSPEDAVKEATRRHMEDCGIDPAHEAGGITWKIASLHDEGVQSAEWEDGSVVYDTYTPYPPEPYVDFLSKHDRGKLITCLINAGWDQNDAVTVNLTWREDNDGFCLSEYTVSNADLSSPWLDTVYVAQTQLACVADDPKTHTLVIVIDPLDDDMTLLNTVSRRYVRQHLTDRPDVQEDPNPRNRLQRGDMRIVKFDVMVWNGTEWIKAAFPHLSNTETVT